jgi:hypothetical protein
MNVKQLREFLAKEEQAWSPLDQRILGEFEEQGLFVYLKDRGIARVESVEWNACYGIVFILKERK